MRRTLHLAQVGQHSSIIRLIWSIYQSTVTKMRYDSIPAHYLTQLWWMVWSNLRLAIVSGFLPFGMPTKNGRRGWELQGLDQLPVPIMSTFWPMVWGTYKRENGVYNYNLYVCPFLIDIDNYANMDFIFLSSIIGTMLLLLWASYDIACQWSRNFRKRMERMPCMLQLPENLAIKFCVPKFHLPGHTKKCWGPYSFNYSKGVGRTDGEGVERNWSWLNGIAPCVSMMGPGGRSDTIDDICNYSNWRKTVTLGMLTHYLYFCAVLNTGLVRWPATSKAYVGNSRSHLTFLSISHFHWRFVRRTRRRVDRMGETSASMGVWQQLAMSIWPPWSK